MDLATQNLTLPELRWIIVIDIENTGEKIPTGETVKMNDGLIAAQLDNMHLSVNKRSWLLTQSETV